MQWYDQAPLPFPGCRFYRDKLLSITHDCDKEGGIIYHEVASGLTEPGSVGLRPPCF